MCMARCDVCSIKTTELIFYTGGNNHPEPSGKSALEFTNILFRQKARARGQIRLPCRGCIRSSAHTPNF
jgi:hypothetical protein